ncbi:flagellar protein FlaG [Aeromonas veronii]|uniref:Flagellar protein FlaG n=1 Tax=Aeromonas veronii TaxID=654 RepID=A0AAW5MPE4_AERVE|nr:flagellar protein FlaG [Aeromonas veronii]MCR4451376.1 flagellar protein FlaG [Aeromonas veronii]
MANESIAMPSVTSTLAQHGGPQAAMSVSPLISEERVKEQVGVDPTAKASQEPSAQIKVSASRAEKAQLEKQAQELQERLDSLSRVKGWTINFSLVPELDQPVIKVIDADTRQVIRQIPSEEILLMKERLQGMEQGGGDSINLSGLLFNGQV